MNSDPVRSSSPAFGTPAHPVRTNRINPAPARTSILPILLPPSTLRPVAFRTFTRKHNLTISSSALQALATFVGKNCGSGWREEGLAERVLDEVAKSWRKAGGGVIVEEGKGASLKAILQTLEGNMSGGRVIDAKLAAKEGLAKAAGANGNNRVPSLQPSHSTGLSEDQAPDDSDDNVLHPRRWIKVIEAFDIPRLTYNADKKHFEVTKFKPSLFPPPSHKTALFRDRYNIVYQRLLRNESFQVSLASSGGRGLQRASSSFDRNQCYKLTPVANLLGRSGTSHLLLGLLSVSPTGELSLTDITGSIVLELSHARMIPADGAWLSPGMFVLVDGIYEEEENVRGSTLGGNSGIGGAIGGRFVGISICGPPCERRETSLGTSNQENGRDISLVEGLEVHRRLKMVIMGEVNLDNMKTLDALRKVLALYNDLPLQERPVAFVLMGNFVQKAIINGGGQGGSIEYKECFDMLALILSEFPSLLQRSTFIFVPGDNDPWSSAFTAGATSTIPRHEVPELFTSRVKRAFASANSQLDRNQTSEPGGEAIWTSNPSRITLFGPVHDIAVLRDDISGRLRRSAVSVARNDPTTVDGLNSTADLEDQADAQGHPGADRSNPASPATHSARKLVKTVLDQGTMSPFPQSLRPVLWDYASSLQLYPLPTAFILADSEAVSFCVTYEGCHVMNPGRGRVKEERF
ncbi:hypothetical protein AOCH_001164 [Aspergillus ochraceoroseus]|uniref:DNA polymerase epsilon subunit B n=1 Tax=Aspergillus ochraceoroseus TaxID=138278 RepID=A0A0F8UMU3_9EURO|nr:hypothetical protein AOCH_001164 [Aspergillus ochraceoroseus]